MEQLDVLLSVDRMRCFENNLAEYKGDLRLGVGETLLCYRMPDILKSFHWHAPNAKLFLLSIHLVKNNVGISFLPTFAVRDEIKNGELAEIKTGLSDIRISAVCGYNKNKWLSPAMEHFVGLIDNLN